MLKYAKKTSVAIAMIIFILLLTYCGVSLQLIEQMEGDSRQINYLGIVQGATQRLVKQELAGYPDDQLIHQIDGILSELLTGSGENQLQKADDPILLEQIQALDGAWHAVKGDIYALRSGAVNGTLLKDSEAHFILSDETVEIAKKRSADKVQIIKLWLFALGITTVTLGLYTSTTWYRAHCGVEKLAFKDEITGTDNMNFFRLKAPRLLAENRENPYAVVYLDINMFRYINNIFGFSAGDEVLRLTAEQIHAALDEEKEIFARYINDHYLLLVRYVGNDALIKRLHAIQRKIHQEGREFISGYKLSFSAGVYCVVDAREDLYKMINYANIARKKVKGNHKSACYFYGKDIHDQLLNRQSIETVMYNALENKEFIAYLQPKFDLQTRRVSGAEALVRWLTSEGKLISPAQFIPIFEQNGFITRIDFAVFKQVCAMMRKWLDAGLEPPPVSVNFSRLHLYDTNLAARLKPIIESYQVPPRYIQIEITESAAIKSIENFVRVMAELHDLGFKIEIDDFGTGYSSLRLLRELTIDGIKIDKSIIDDIETNKRSRIIVTKVIEMAKELKIKTVAEGVELMEQAALLENIQCDLGQGYLFARPMPIVEYELLTFGKAFFR